MRFDWAGAFGREITLLAATAEAETTAAAKVAAAKHSRR